MQPPGSRACSRRSSSLPSFRRPSASSPSRGPRRVQQLGRAQAQAAQQAAREQMQAARLASQEQIQQQRAAVAEHVQASRAASQAARVQSQEQIQAARQASAERIQASRAASQADALDFRRSVEAAREASPRTACGHAGSTAERRRPGRYAANRRRHWHSHDARKALCRVSDELCPCQRRHGGEHAGPAPLLCRD